MIQCSMMWHDVENNLIMLAWDSHSHGTHECIESWTLQDFGLCRLTPNGGECGIDGHFLKTLLVDHNQSNNRDILGQKTQKTQQSNKG